MLPLGLPFQVDSLALTCLAAILLYVRILAAFNRELILPYLLLITF